jgi:bifunctional NMN adenylyltransferase/nudix hydrolase
MKQSVGWDRILIIRIKNMSEQKRYPTVFPTVDVVIEHGGKLLLGRKAHQQKFRFIGGFADPALDNSYEDAAKREAKEETDLTVSTVRYLGSTRIDDPRYRGTPDCIITHLFLAAEWEGSPKASDDIAELKWFSKEEVSAETFVDEHHVLWDLFCASGK